ncbi:Usherin [Varanus komodoensis]|nr:Usherin [Varanus komodoensis]
MGMCGCGLLGDLSESKTISEQNVSIDQSNMHSPDGMLPPRLSSATPTSLQVVWSIPVRNNAPGLPSYRLQMRPKHSPEDILELFSKPSASLNYIVKDLQPYTSYEMRVIACNGYGDAYSNWSVMVTAEDSKPSNITVVQVYAPTIGAEEAEGDRFYEGLQHLLELTPKNEVLIIMGDWNAKAGSQKITGITGKLKLKKVGKSTRPLKYDLNHIPDEYTVEVTNRYKELDLIDRVPEELWTGVRNIVQEVATKTIPKKKKCKKAKWQSEETLQIAEERRDEKGKGERVRYSQMNAEFQRIARRDKNAFLNEQCKEIEENNRIGRASDLFKKIGDMKGTFHAKMGMIKDQNGRDLTEAEKIKKRWQDYKEELYKKELNVPDNHDGVVTDLEPDILECEVKWALGSLSNYKASGGYSIPADLFKILKDDAVKVLH